MSLSHLTTGFRAGVLAVVCALGLGVFSAQIPAKAETSEELQAKATELQGRIETSAANYDSAMAKVADLQKQAEENQAKIDEVKAQIPTQREKSAAAIRTLYKMDQNAPGLLGLVLSSENFNDFISTLTYLNAVESSTMKEATRLTDLENELTRNQAELDAARQEAQEQRDAAAQALADAQSAREEAQRAADEQAAKEAAEREAAIAAEREAQAKAAEADKAQPAPEPQHEDASGNETPVATTPNVPASSSPSKVNWSDSKQAFVDQWAPRINRYLAGSPMAGTGETFASAAWDYGVDPRWSPAISNTESSKGAVCFKPYNAWGWGNSSWGSWDEAIRDHVAGLARGYGSTLSMEAARKYCPPSPDHWYATTLAEMEKI